MGDGGDRVSEFRRPGDIRVSLREGREPVIFVAPHGFRGDDQWTCRIATQAARACGGYAVVNHGWERAETVDIEGSKANCNNVNHLGEDVVCEEFLGPILRFHQRCLRKHGKATFVMIHGLGQPTCQNFPLLDVVLGFGNGKPPSYTMGEDDRRRLPRLFYDGGLIPYIGMAGGRYTGWARPNLNQYWRKWQFDPDVDSVQIEVAWKHREQSSAAYLFGDKLGEVFASFLAGTSPISTGTFAEI